MELSYKVINKFYDKENKDTFYNVGDEYPKGDYKPTKKRIEGLSKVHPEYNRAFIEEEKKEKKKDSSKE
jgi:hypothetical protein